MPNHTFCPRVALIRHPISVSSISSVKPTMSGSDADHPGRIYNLIVWACVYGCPLEPSNNAELVIQKGNIDSQNCLWKDSFISDLLVFDRYEYSGRGVYGGAVGVMGREITDMALPIRAVFRNPSEAIPPMTGPLYKFHASFPFALIFLLEQENIKRYRGVAILSFMPLEPRVAYVSLTKGTAG